MQFAISIAFNFSCDTFTDAGEERVNTAGVNWNRDSYLRAHAEQN